MPTMQLTGHAAVDYAARHALTLSSYTSPIEAAHDGDLSVALAREIVAADPGLVYLAVEVVAAEMSAECLTCGRTGERRMVVGETEHDSLRALDACPRCHGYDARGESGEE